MQIQHLWVVHLPEHGKPESLSSDLFLSVESLLGIPTWWTHIIHTLEKVHQKPESGRPPMADPVSSSYAGRKAQLITVFGFHHLWICQRQTQDISQPSQEPYQFHSNKYNLPIHKTAFRRRQGPHSPFIIL